MNNELIERIDDEIERRRLESLEVEAMGWTPLKYHTDRETMLKECKAALSEQAEPVASSQDVDAFIAARSTNAADLYCDAVSVSDLREWMAGHVRAKEVAAKEWNQAEGRDGKLYTDGWNDCRTAMLAASKERTE